jgi:hypothetical protein
LICLAIRNFYQNILQIDKIALIYVVSSSFFSRVFNE